MKSMKTNIRRDDTVQIMSGADRGKSGKVIQVFPKEHMVVVEGLNERSKAVRPKQQGRKGEIIKFNAPLRLDNVMLVCPNCHKQTRIQFTVLTDSKKRTCSKCKQIIDK